MSIIKAKITDLENIMKMYKSCIDGMINIGIDQWDNTYPDHKTISEDIKNSTYFIYKIKDEIIGGINIDRNQDPTYLNINWINKTRKFFVVHRLAIKQEYWWKGIGKKCMEFAENLALKNNLVSVRLDTYSNNPQAMKFYQDIGYNQLGHIYLKSGKNEYYCFEKIIK